MASTFLPVMATTTAQEAEASLIRLILWIKKASSLCLTLFWIHSFHSFFFSAAFNSLQSFNITVTLGFLLLMASQWLLCCLLFGNHKSSRLYQEELSWTWSSPLLRAFWIERSGMLLMGIAYLFGLPGKLCFGIFAVSCLIQFLVTHLVLLASLLHQEEGLEKITRFGTFKAHNFILSLSRPFQILVNEPSPRSNKSVLEGGIEILDVNDDESDLPPIEELLEKELNKSPSEVSFKILDTKIDKLSRQIEALLDVEEVKQEEKKSIKSFLEQLSLEMMATDDDARKGKIQELEKKIDSLEEQKQKLQQTCKEIETQGKQKMDELFSKLCTATTEAEFYRLQAKESKEKLGTLEQEKDYLIIQLCAANSTTELYRSLLHGLGLYI